MNKKLLIILITIIIILICIVTTLSIWLYKIYTEGPDIKLISPSKTLDFNIIQTVKRIGIMTSGGEHIEVTKKEDIQDIIYKLNTLKLEIDPDHPRDLLPGFNCKVTLYTMLDGVVWEGLIVDDDTIKYGNSYYTVTEGKFNMEDIKAVIYK